MTKGARNVLIVLVVGSMSCVVLFYGAVTGDIHDWTQTIERMMDDAGKSPDTQKKGR